MIIRAQMGADGAPFNAVTGTFDPGPWRPTRPPPRPKAKAVSEGPEYHPELMGAPSAKKASVTKYIVGGLVVAAGVGYALLGRKRR